MLPILILAIAVLGLAFTLIAAVRARGGQRYRYPICLRLLRPTRRSVALVIRNQQNADGSECLAVQRPADDADLPLAWGLPAVSLGDGETSDAAVTRCGREKLGVELKKIGVISSGSLKRRDYRIEMQLIEAQLVDGVPTVPQDVEGVTQYDKWKWAERSVLKPAAAQGSLCCRLYLES